MKKKLFLAMALAAVLFPSCKKEQFQEAGEKIAPPAGYFALTAGNEINKSTINGFLMYWAKTDTLIVFDSSRNGIKFSTVDNNVETATFSTPEWSGNIPTYAAAYNPDYAEQFNMIMPEDGKITVKFRPAQKIQWTQTCARQATAAVGRVEYDSKSATYSVPAMKNITGFISFRLVDANVKKLVAEAPGGESMAGWVDVDVAKLEAGDSSFWTATAGKTPSSKITVTCSDNAAEGGCFKAAKYYFTLLPQTYSQGIKFTTYDASNQVIDERTIGSKSGFTIRAGEVRAMNQAIDDSLPATITVDLQFYNSTNTNPLGFGTKTADSESATGEEYTYTYNYDDHGVQKSLELPFVVCKGNQASARYSYDQYTLVYPAGTKGKILVFDKAYGWMKVPAIRGHYLASVTYEHGNGYMKQMVMKETLNPSVTVAYTSAQADAKATAEGAWSETINFYRNSTSGNVTANTKENTPYYLQFIGAATRVYRIKLVYTTILPTPATFPVESVDFPKVQIHTHGQLPIVSKDEYVQGSIYYDDVNGVNPGKTSIHIDKTAKFKGRGNSTWGMPKKPYRIKLDSKVSFFDLGKDKDWCMLANYTDKSLMRNLVAMEVSKILGFPWTPTMYPVEFWLNDQYQGLYTFSEHKKVSSARINIVPPEDGGKDMYLEVDQGMDELCCFYSATDSIPVMFNTPEEPADSMLNETKQWFDDFEAALHSPSFPSSGYEAYIDVDSFVDHYIIQELAKNVDGRMNKGGFITRTMGGPIRFYHEWDFDIAFGNDCDLVKINPADKELNNGPTGWLIKNYTHNKKDQGWYPTLFKDPAFVQKVKDRWNEVYTQLQGVSDYIDQHGTLFADSASRNFQRWQILGLYVWPNVVWPKTYAEEVQYLKDFYIQRLDWLNTNINAL